MSLLKKSCAPVVFFTDKTKLDTWDALYERLHGQEFIPTDRAVGRWISYGWVDASRPFLEVADSAMLGEYIVLGFRYDFISVAPGDIKFEASRREREWLRENGAEKMPVVERAKLYENVEKDLKDKAQPKRKVAQVVWCPSTGVLLAQPCPRVLQEALTEHFEDTFGLRIWVSTPVVQLAYLRGSVEYDVREQVTDTYGPSDGILESLAPFIAWIGIQAEHEPVLTFAKSKYYARPGNWKAFRTFTSRLEVSSDDADTEATLMTLAVRKHMTYPYAGTFTLEEDLDAPSGSPQNLTYRVKMSPGVWKIQELSIPPVIEEGDSEFLMIARLDRLFRIVDVLGHLINAFLDVRSDPTAWGEAQEKMHRVSEEAIDTLAGVVQELQESFPREVILEDDLPGDVQ